MPRSHQSTVAPKSLRSPMPSLLLFVSLIVAATTSVMAAEQVTAPRPNVLFILCDDLRPDALSCYGSRHVKTPQIDRVAREGVRFANAFCTTSLCSPSRASILSGLYAHVHGVTNNFTEYPERLPSFPRILQQQGYRTAYIGKYHMGEENDRPRPGFDYFVTHKGQGKYYDTEWNLNGQRSEVIPGYYTTVVTDLALDWLRQQQSTAKAAQELSPTKKDQSDKKKDQQPWCLMVGHKAPHSFYTPEPKYAHSFDDVRVPYPASAFQLADKPDWIKQRLPTWHGIYGPLFDWRKKFPDERPEAVKDFENMVHGYWGTVLSVDDSVGRLLTSLQESGQLDQTIVVFMGDNGLLEGEHGMVDKRTAHEASIRIPIIVRYPGLSKTGRVVEQQVLTLDMAPSLLELCQAPKLNPVHGRSWVKLIEQGDADWRTSWFYHYNYEKQFPYTPNVRAVRTDRWKYIHYPHGDTKPNRHLSELYDLRNDPGELQNLIQSPEHRATVAELQVELTRLMTAADLPPTSDRMPLDEGVKGVLPDAKIR
ncbi:MAG: sulfatase [Planctomycetota bacterium]